jgi:hypothetical protein
LLKGNARHSLEYLAYGGRVSAKAFLPFLRLRKGQKGCIVGTRKQTNPDAAPAGSVSEQQKTAITLLISGRNLQEVADMIGVQRPTISLWLHHVAPFQAELNARRQEAFDSMIERLRALLPKALDVIEAQLQGDNPLPAAIQILRSCGLAQGLGRPSGPATVEEAERAQRQREIEQASTALTPEDVALAQRAREQQRLFAELTL